MRPVSLKIIERQGNVKDEACLTEDYRKAGEHVKDEAGLTEDYRKAG